MTQTLSYESAVNKLSMLETKATLSKSIDVFDRSLILAVLFDKGKDETFNDLVKARQEDMGIKKR